MATPKCPFCGRLAAEHVAAGCLDRWVHERFVGRTVPPDEAVPPYSLTPRHSCLNDLINAPIWEDAAAVMQTTAGCSVGILVREEGAYEHYKIVVAADPLPLAVCRAAVSGLAGGGKSGLAVK